MKTLYLLRHAKSSWGDSGLADHDRPLAPRGRKAASRVGRHLHDRGMRPDLILCSTARRAVDTLDLVLDAFAAEDIPAKDIPIEREHGLYLCGSRILLERVRDAPDEVASLMLVAHNPDLHELANRLVGDGPADARTALQAKYPTAACAVIAFDGPHWRDLEPGSGRLIDFMLPRTLA